VRSNYLTVRLGCKEGTVSEKDCSWSFSAPVNDQQVVDASASW